MYLGCEKDLAFWNTYLNRAGPVSPRAAELEEQVVLQSIACACRASRWLEQVNRGPFLVGQGSSLFEQMHITVIPMDLPNIPLFGEYDHGKKSIFLYSRTIERYADRFEGEAASLTDICMMHELYHAIEAQALGETRKVICKQLGRRLFGSRAAGAASEIAAHSFAKLVLSLSELPIDRMTRT